MSMFKDILSRIFGHAASAETPSSPNPPASPPAPQIQPASRGSVAAGPVAQPTVDVAGVLDALAKQKKQKLNWRKSIVDLMKLLDLDSSLGARKELAQELGYKGALDGSAEMNVWLHKQVMEKLAEGGGKVPASLKG